MAKFRQVMSEYWTDPQMIEEMTSEDKYFYLYLLTNPQTRQCGIYQISSKQMALETGYSEDACKALIKRFVEHHKKIKYNYETRELAIKNWMKYNSINSPKVQKCIEKEMETIKDKSLINYVLYGMDTVSIPYSELKKTAGEEENKNNNKNIKKNSEFYNSVDSWFKTNNESYYRDAKESKQLKNIEIRFLSTYTDVFGVLDKFKELTTTGDKFWSGQPLVPSRFYSLIDSIISAKIDKPFKYDEFPSQ